MKIEKCLYYFFDMLVVCEYRIRVLNSQFPAASSYILENVVGLNIIITFIVAESLFYIQKS